MTAQESRLDFHQMVKGKTNKHIGNIQQYGLSQGDNPQACCEVEIVQDNFRETMQYTLAVLLGTQADDSTNLCAYALSGRHLFEAAEY